MNINPVNRTNNINMKSKGELEISPDISVCEDKDIIMKELDKMSSINHVNVSSSSIERFNLNSFLETFT